MGSSPLTRGKRSSARPGNASGGLIPAHAGKTTRDTSLSRWRRAHPRSRGENRGQGDLRPDQGGSSPLTRGKRLVRRSQLLIPGLIPAHAGKTTSRAASSLRGGAHPRSRGENSTTPGRRFALTGSSPLTRGKRASGGARRGLRRLIPAHAGKTPGYRRGRGGQPAHPRSRGENIASLASLSKRRGSSPLTRGKPVDRSGNPSTRGLIPAHAGKTGL